MKTTVKKKHPNFHAGIFYDGHPNYPISVGCTMRSICFSCRKCFHTLYWPRIHEQTCPDCKRPLVGAGTHFKPPKRSNIKAWKLLEATIIDAGYVFMKNGAGPVPSSVKGAKIEGISKQFWADCYSTSSSYSTHHALHEKILKEKIKKL